MLQSKLSVIVLISFLLVTLFAFKMTDNEKDVKKIASKFVKAADVQDADMLASTLYPEAMQFVLFGPKVMKSNAEQYIEQIRAKKLGGHDRPVTFDQVEMTGENAAMVKLKAVGGGLAFQYHLTLFKLEGEWKIMTITTTVQKQG
ncbi:MAG: nuclear transport factor 2 family protein [Bacteroidota bacterium]